MWESSRSGARVLLWIQVLSLMSCVTLTKPASLSVKWICCLQGLLWGQKNAHDITLSAIKKHFTNAGHNITTEIKRLSITSFLFPEHRPRLNWLQQWLERFFCFCKINLFTFAYLLFLDVLGLRCCARLSLVAASRCYFLQCAGVAVHGLHIVMASLFAEHGL